VEILEAVPEPVEEVQCLSSKRLGEINEIFAIFQSDENPDHLNILDLNFAIKSFGIDLSVEDLEKLVNKEREFGRGSKNRAQFYFVSYLNESAGVHFLDPSLLFQCF
jgi:hypothetical protein